MRHHPLQGYLSLFNSMLVGQHLQAFQQDFVGIPRSFCEVRKPVTPVILFEPRNSAVAATQKTLCVWTVREHAYVMFTAE